MATLTIRDISEHQIDVYKQFTGEKTSAKALIRSADKAIELAAALEKANELINRLTEELSVRNQVLDRLTPLCIQVAELSGQGDIIYS